MNGEIILAVFTIILALITTYLVFNKKTKHTN